LLESQKLDRQPNTRKANTESNEARILPPMRVVVKRLRAGVGVSFGIGPLSKHPSFPRKRESSPSAAHFQWLAEEIPAFAGMTSPGGARSSQMTPLPGQLFSLPATTNVC